MNVLVLADTHAAVLPETVRPHLERADHVLHAGDVTQAAVLDELRAQAPLTAVLGNNDLSLVGLLPERTVVTLAGVRVAMVHDSGATTGRAGRLRRWFPDADVVVFGHSHLPVDGEGVDGQRLFNPGSPTQRRRAPFRSVGWLTLLDGLVVDSRLVEV